MAVEKISQRSRKPKSAGEIRSTTDCIDTNPEHLSRNVSSSLSLPSQSSFRNNSFPLGCLIYFSYSMSIAVDSQFLSLYYKSKGFDGATLGMLYSLTPMTTFLTVPIWSLITAGRDTKHPHRRSGGIRSNANEEVSETALFKTLYFCILLATASQISLAIFNDPIYMMLAVTIAGIFQSPVKPMLDGIIMDQLKDRTEFGKVRFFSILGSGFGTHLGGRLLSSFQATTDHDPETRDNNEDKSVWDTIWNLSFGFNLLFFARILLTIPPILLIRYLHVAASKGIESGGVVPSTHKRGREKRGQSSLKNENPTQTYSLARSVISAISRDNLHLLFFVCIFIAGASGGVSDAFSYLRYQESGCSTVHIGQSRLLSSFAGAIMFWYSGRVTQLLGIQNVLVLTMICTGIRFSLLRQMKHPGYVYLIDLIRGATYGIFWSSSTIFASQIGPPSLRATILLLLNGIYNGIGRSTGGFLGGKFQGVFGIDNLYLWCSRINFTLAIALAILCYRNQKQGSDCTDHRMHGKNTMHAKKVE